MWYFQNKYLKILGIFIKTVLKYLVIVINPCKSLLVFIKIRLNIEEFIKRLS